MASDFHEVRFPLDVALGRRGGPGRRTDIVTLASGREQRNSRRVGGDVAIPAPHRPGRADFPHPVLQERALLPTV